MAKVFPIFKKKDSLDKDKSIPLSILSYLSKVFERLMFKQIDNYRNDKLLPLLTGFRKNYNIHHWLLAML